MRVRLIIIIIFIVAAVGAGTFWFLRQSGTFNRPAGITAGVEIGAGATRSGPSAVASLPLKTPLYDFPLFEDPDGDGLLNYEELLLGRNPQVADFARGGKDQDHDGLSDALETWFGTDPQKGDSDADGEDDGFEFEAVAGGAKSKDSDKDGLSDFAETTWYKTDPNKADTDADGYLDGAEILNGYNPRGEGRL